VDIQKRIFDLLLEALLEEISDQVMDVIDNVLEDYPLLMQHFEGSPSGDSHVFRPGEDGPAAY
jgi:hypothetical protein